MTETDRLGPKDVLAFWRDAGQDKWFAKSDGFDQEIEGRFAGLYREAAAGRHDDWAGTPEGALALILLFDQFSRNLFRGSAETYAQDAKAREIARRAIEAGFDKVEPAMRQFFYLPFMHSEAIADLDRCVMLAHALGDAETLKFARHHRDIVRRFGRFPHRNRILGRESSAAEQAFLDGGGFSG